DVAFDRVAGAKSEAADLRGRDIDVVGTRKIVRLGRAQEAEAVGEHLDDALADDVGFLDRELLEDAEHQLLLAHGAGVLDGKLFGEGDKFGWSLGLDVLEFHFPHAGGPGNGAAICEKSIGAKGWESQVLGAGSGLAPDAATGPTTRAVLGCICLRLGR